MAPLVRRTWSPRGQPPVLVQRTRAYQKVSVIGALCVPPQRDRVYLYFRLHPDTNLTGPLVIAFLRQLARQLDAPFVLLWDRLRAHRASTRCSFPLMRRTSIRSSRPGAISNAIRSPIGPSPRSTRSLPSRIVTRHRHLQRDHDLLRSFIEHSPLSLRLK